MMNTGIQGLSIGRKVLLATLAASVVVGVLFMSFSGFASADEAGPSTDPTKGTLKMRKMVEDLHGATVPYTDFSFSIDGGAPIPFNVDGKNWIPMDPGTYTVREIEARGFAAPEYIAHCFDTGVVTIVAGETTYCTIVNRGIAPQLTITKVVDNGSTTGAQVSDFRLFAGSIEFTSGVPQNIDVGTYTISEMGPLDGYVGATVCAINNTIVDLGSANELTLGLGDSAECVVLNVKDIPDVEVPSDPATTTATTTCATTPTAAGCGSTGTTTATTTATSTPDATGTTTPTTTPEVTTPSTSSSGGGGNGKRVSLSDGNGGGGNGGGNDTNPQGEVLGASTGGLPTDLQGEVKGAVAPAGAPNTGFGGMSSRDSSTFTYALLGYFVLAALFGVWVVRRTAVNG